MKRRVGKGWRNLWSRSHRKKWKQTAARRLMAKASPFASKRGKSLRIQGAADLVALFIATGFGAGFVPFSPGTFGSIVGLLIAYVLISAFGSDALLLQNAILAAG